MPYRLLCHPKCHPGPSLLLPLASQLGLLVPPQCRSRRMAGLWITLLGPLHLPAAHIAADSTCTYAVSVRASELSLRT